jgi:hypothetical protein
LCFLYFNSHRKEIESLEITKNSLQKEVIIINKKERKLSEYFLAITATFVLDIETINIMDHLKTPNKEIS